MGYGIVIWIVIFHWIDMLFTVLLLLKVEKYYVNAYMVELNYHRWFFKKFGIVKGALYSIPISTALIVMVGIILMENDYLYIILGMAIAMAYMNYMSWSGYDDVREKMKRKK